MQNRLPRFESKEKICIICEGPEEYEYLDKLKHLDVWNKKYSITLDNAGGNGNVPARYQDKYQNGSYDVVLAFCDTDKKPYEQYADIKKKINEFHDVDTAADEVVIYGNPCTMQIVLEHWIDVKLKSSAKKVNAPIIQKFTGVKNYKARADQRWRVYEQITKENYQQMMNRVKQLTDNDSVVGSSNFGRFLDYFMSEDNKWIHKINKKLENQFNILDNTDNI